MHRIDHTTKDVDLFGSGKHGFTEGTPGTEAATVVTDDWLNGVQEEICNTVETCFDLSKGTRDQLRQTLLRWMDIQCLMSRIKQTPDASFSGTFYAVGTRDYQTTGASVVTAVIAGTSGEIQTGTQPDSWTHRASAGSYSGTFLCCRWIEFISLWLLGGTSGEIESSSNAVTWAQRTPGSSYTGDFNTICDDGSIAVMGGTGGEIQSSTNGTTWTQRKTGGDDIEEIIHDGSQFVAIDAGGLIWTSSDGITWSSGTDIGAISATCIFYDDISGLYLAGHTSGVYRSSNLTSWSADTMDGGALGVRRILKMSDAIVEIPTAGYDIFIRNMDDNTWYRLFGYTGYGRAEWHKSDQYPLFVGSNGLIQTGLAFRLPY